MKGLKTKIKEDKDCFCGAFYNRNNCPILADYLQVNGKLECETGCRLWLHKWPTPEQYREEYGRDLQDNDAIYFLAENEPYPGERYAQWWQVEQYCEVEDTDSFIVCACTPFGRPSDEWRPK
jgi:hypothetical protein